MNLEDKIASLRSAGWELGDAASEITATGSGRCQVFPLATIYENANGEAYEVHGLIRDKYADFNQTVGDLGFPLSDEQEDPNVTGGRMNSFEHGTINWDPNDGVSVTLSASNNNPEGTTENGGSDNGDTEPGDSGNGGSPAEEETSFATRAREAYDAIVEEHPQLKNAPAATGGHSSSNEVFSPEYDQLQKLITKINFWTEREENARLLLVAYATAEVGKLIGTIPGNIMYQIERIGLSESNEKAIKDYRNGLKAAGNDIPADAPSLADFHVNAGVANWCAQTQSWAFINALAQQQLKLTKGWGEWIKEKGRMLYAKDGDLETGDWFTMVSLASPLSGHVGGCIKLDGDTLYYISGNAGGGAIGSDGTVRIDKVEVETAPADYKWNSEPDSAPKRPGKNSPAKPGVVWLISIIKTSAIDFSNPEALKEDPAALAKAGLTTK